MYFKDTKFKVNGQIIHFSYFMLIFFLLLAHTTQAEFDRQARNICDDLTSAQDFVRSSMLIRGESLGDEAFQPARYSPEGEEFTAEELQTEDDPVEVNLKFQFYPKKHTPRDMIELAKKGEFLKCFARHTTRPSAFNRAKHLNDLLLEVWPPYNVIYKFMAVDYNLEEPKNKVVVYIEEIVREE